ncbi:hypothetical protein ASE25_19350 [Terrabacter sp. Root85]|uniref:hypothetical protein n=1 Tax=Terrabacter sp. Root85 TaxID=1736603 RepID=UPI0006FD72B7|nr:hypothetical protein [Terrabacter sp. Root85]KRC85208.1 hypothetical protein ASE25_19350 [Terrabacter sp. Root85]
MADLPVTLTLADVPEEMLSDVLDRVAALMWAEIRPVMLQREEAAKARSRAAERSPNVTSLPARRRRSA